MSAERATEVGRGSDPIRCVGAAVSKLWHFTCEHQAEQIDRTGTLIPNDHLLLGTRLTWLTDLPEPWPEALGLTSRTLTCDRTAIRYQVHPDDVAKCERYTAWARRTKLPHASRAQIETGCLPTHWWVTEVPLRVIRSLLAVVSPDPGTESRRG